MLQYNKEMIMQLIVLLVILSHNCDASEYCMKAGRYCSNYCCHDEKYYSVCCPSCSASVYTNYCSAIYTSIALSIVLPIIFGLVVPFIMGIIILILYCLKCCCFQDRKRGRTVLQPQVPNPSSQIVVQQAIPTVAGQFNAQPPPYPQTDYTNYPAVQQSSAPPAQEFSASETNMHKSGMN